jgi:hypothetical protein
VWLLPDFVSQKALAAIMAKVKMRCRAIGSNQPLQDLLDRLNPAVRGLVRLLPGRVSSATFFYLRHYFWQTVWRWLRRKHRKSTWKQLRRQYCGGWWPTGKEIRRFDPSSVTTGWYRYRGTKIPPHSLAGQRVSESHGPLTGLVESPLRRKAHGFGKPPCRRGSRTSATCPAPTRPSRRRRSRCRTWSCG